MECGLEFGSTVSAVVVVIIAGRRFDHPSGAIVAVIAVVVGVLSGSVPLVGHWGSVVGRIAAPFSGRCLERWKGANVGRLARRPFGWTGRPVSPERFDLCFAEEWFLRGRRVVLRRLLTLSLQIFLDFGFDGIQRQVFPSMLCFDVG